MDCRDAYALSEFWRPILGYVDNPNDPNEPGHEECPISVVIGFYRTCTIDGLLPTSPAEHVRRPNVPPGSPIPTTGGAGG